MGKIKYLFLTFVLAIDIALVAAIFYLISHNLNEVEWWMGVLFGACFLSFNRFQDWSPVRIKKFLVNIDSYAKTGKPKIVDIRDYRKNVK